MAMWSIVVCAEDAAPAKIEEKPKGYVGITVENSGLKYVSVIPFTIQITYVPITESFRKKSPESAYTPPR